MDKTRALAVRLLMRCEDAGYSNLVLKSALEQQPLEPREKAFVSALVYGTVERQRLLDALLDSCLKKPCARLDAPVRAILRSGLYQCRWMDGVPTYAAVNAAVELTRHFGKSSAAGMVNAVLRKAAQTPVKALSFPDEIARLGTLYSVSDSIAAMLLRVYGLQQAETVLQAFAEPAVTFLRANLLRTTPAELCERLRQEGIAAVPAAPEGAVRLTDGGDIAHTQAFAQGLFHVQGLSSQLAALAVQVVPGETVLDVCAAPGGKSLTLAQQMKDSGTLLCGELQPSRVRLIQQQLQRCGVHCARALCADAAEYQPDFPAADAVLCDVPCSGTGILAHKPDIRYKDVDEGRDALQRLQSRILQTAARYVKAGGRLVYSTCSLDPAENEAVVEAFLHTHPDFSLQPWPLPTNAALMQAPGQRPGMVTLLPTAGGCDGFFIAKLKKV